MRKLIDPIQKYLVICDNKHCDYKVDNESGDPRATSIEYIDKPCPKCGENLLTLQDYNDYKKLLNRIDWINKYFSWILFFIPKKTKPQKASIHIHNGLTKIEKIEDINP